MEKRKHGVLNNIWFVFKPVFKASPAYIIALIIEAVLFVLLPLGGISFKCLCDRDAWTEDEPLDNTFGSDFCICCVWYCQCSVQLL